MMDDLFDLLGSVLLVLVLLLGAAFLGTLAARIWLGLWP